MVIIIYDDNDYDHNDDDDHVCFLVTLKYSALQIPHVAAAHEEYDRDHDHKHHGLDHNYDRNHDHNTDKNRVISVMMTIVTMTMMITICSGF